MVNRMRGMVAVASDLRGQGQAGQKAAIPGDTGVEQAANAFAGEFARIGARVGELADRAAAQEGDLAGRAAGLDPEFRTRRDLTIRGEAFDRAGLQVAETRLRVALDDELGKIGQAHAADPKTTAEKAASISQALISGAPAELRPQLTLQAEGARKALVRQASRQQIAQQRASQTAAVQSDVEGLLKTLHQRSFALGLDADADTVVGQHMAQLKSVLNRKGVDGRPLVSPESAAKVLRGAREEVTQARLLGAFERLDTVDAKRKLIAGLDDDFKNGTGLGGEFDLDEYRRMRGTLETGLRRAEAAMETQSRALVSEINSVTKRIGKGYVPDPDQMAALKAKALGVDDPAARMLLDRAEDMMRFQGIARTRSPAELDSAIQDMRDRMRTGSNPEDEIRLEMLEGLRDEMSGALKKDQLEWADRTGLIPLKPLALPADTSDPQAMVAFQATVRERVAQAELVGDRFGLRPVYLRPQEKRALLSTMAKGGAGTLAVAETLVSAVGRDRAVQVMAELSDEGPALAHLGGLTARMGATLVAREAADGLAARRIKGSALPTPDAADTDPVIEGQFGTTFRALPGYSDTIKRLANAAYSIRAANAGETGFNAELYANIVNELVGQGSNGGVAYGGIIDQNGTFAARAPVVVPHDVRQSAFRDLIDLVRPEDLGEALPLRGANQPITRAEWADATLISIGGERYWLSASSDQDLGELYNDANNQPYVLDFKSLRPMLKKRRPDLFFGGDE